MKKKDIEWLTRQLRKISLKWRGRRDALKNAPTKLVKVGKTKKGKDKTHIYKQCACCKKFFRLYEVELDHIIEVGSFDSWDGRITRMFCEPDNFQVLCIQCHARKTYGDGNKLHSNYADSEGWKLL